MVKLVGSERWRGEVARCKGKGYVDIAASMKMASIVHGATKARPPHRMYSLNGVHEAGSGSQQSVENTANPRLLHPRSVLSGPPLMQTEQVRSKLLTVA